MRSFFLTLALVGAVAATALTPTKADAQWYRHRGGNYAAYYGPTYSGYDYYAPAYSNYASPFVSPYATAGYVNSFNNPYNHGPIYTTGYSIPGGVFYHYGPAVGGGYYNGPAVGGGYYSGPGYIGFP
jgi:hypothetical protein